MATMQSVQNRLSCPCVASAGRSIVPARKGPTAPLAHRAQKAGEARRSVTVNSKSPGGSTDFDGILSDIADKFEKSSNKGAIIGWTAATAFAIFFSEWLIHLPLFNVLLGFPIQLFGLLLLPYLGVKYLDKGDDYSADFKDVAETVINRLPGLK